MGVHFIAPTKNFKRIIKAKDISKQQKYDDVLGNVSILDQQAKAKEGFMTLIKNAKRTSEKQEEINNLYLDSIKAKIALLQEINK